MILASPPLSYSQMPSNATAARAAPSKSGSATSTNCRVTRKASWRREMAVCVLHYRREYDAKHNERLPQHPSQPLLGSKLISARPYQ